MYKYASLLINDDYVRRSIILPGRDNEHLQGRFETIPLTGSDEVYPFKAISYVWGHGGKESAITIDGKTFKITRETSTNMCSPKELLHSSSRVTNQEDMWKPIVEIETSKETHVK